MKKIIAAAADMMAATAINSAAILMCIRTGNEIWLLMTVAGLWLFVRVADAMRTAKRAEEEKDVWRTMYDLKCEEVLCMSAELDRGEVSGNGGIQI
jgi:hypothetical protein